MKILIIGAGRIGASVAEALVNEDNDITIVDSDGSRIEQLQKRLELRGLVGNALSPKVLINADAAESDMIIAVTASDETNMAVCLLAMRLFNIPTRIARVRNSELRSYPRLLAEEGFQVTSTIWPEATLTASILRLVEFPEVLQLFDFAEGRAALFCVRAVAGSPLVGRPVSDLTLHLPKVPARIVSIFRHNRRLDLKGETVIESGDEVIALSSGRDVRRVIRELRQDAEPIKKIMMGGDIRLALLLADALKGPDSSGDYSICILDPDREKATQILGADKSDALVTIGSITSEESLAGNGIDECDLFIALSNHDETNIMAALLAKKMKAKRVISLTNSQTFIDLMLGSQIDISVSTTQETIGELLKHVRRGDVVNAYSLRRGVAEALEMVAHGDKKSSRIVGRRIRDIDLPQGTSIAALVRESDNSDIPIVIMASGDLEIESEDHIIMFVPNKRSIPQIEQLFAVDVGFF